MKLNCIIDTCSCIILNNAEFKQSSLLSYFNDRSHLSYSKEVKLELNDHRPKGLPQFLFDKKRKLKPFKWTMDEYEMRMVSKVLVSREHFNNKGEIDNFAISIDQVHHIKMNQVIYITDDKKALRGVLSDYFPAFPTLSVWNSLDVVLYLYAENIIPSKDIATEMIQTIVAFSAPPPAERSQKTTDELIDTRKKYTKRIEVISKLLK